MEYMTLYEEGKIDEALKLIKEVGDSFDEPKVDQDLFYLLMEDFINICIESGKIELANKYISLLFASGRGRVDYGDKEFIAGKLAYAQNDIFLTKELFYMASLKSEGALLKGNVNKKFRELIKGM